MAKGTATARAGRRRVTGKRGRTQVGRGERGSRVRWARQCEERCSTICHLRFRKLLGGRWRKEGDEAERPRRVLGWSLVRGDISWWRDE